MRTLTQSLVGLLVLAGLVGCAEETDRPSQLDSLRILAVRSEAPFASPGARPALEMLTYDGSPEAPRPIRTLWIAGCLNPEGDLYYNCYPALHRTLAALSDADLLAEQAPAGVPEEMVTTLADAIKRAVATEQHKTKMGELGYTVRFMDTAQYKAYWDSVDAEVPPLISALRQ